MYMTGKDRLNIAFFRFDKLTETIRYIAVIIRPDQKGRTPYTHDFRFVCFRSQWYMAEQQGWSSVIAEMMDKILLFRSGLLV